MRRKLVRLENGWALPLSVEQLSALGVGEPDTAVLVQFQEGDPPRLIIRRALTVAEAMEETITEHRGVLARLAAVEDSAGDEAETARPG